MTAKGSNNSYYSIMIILLIAYALVYFHRTMTGIMKPEVDEFSRYYGINANILLSTMSSAYFYAYATSQLITGPLLDSYGVKRIGATMLAVLSLGTILMLLKNEFGLIVGRTLIGFAAAVAFLSYMRSSSLYFSKSMQAKLTSFAIMIGNFSTIVSTYPLRIFLQRFGYTTTLLILASISSLLSYLVFKKSSDVGSIEKTSKLRERFAEMKKIASEKHIWGVGIAALAGYGTSIAYQATWGQRNLTEMFGFSIGKASIMLMIIAITATIFSPIVGFISDNVIKRRKPILISTPLSSLIGWFLIYISFYLHNSILLYASMISLGLSIALQIVAPVMAREEVQSKYSGTATAMFNVQVFFGIAILQTISGFLSISSMIIVSIGVSLFGILASILFTRETYKPSL
ncbi:MFS transporter [Fervidicoccus fontis]|nr:MFS transporter [Fervidicoccus fontis]